MPTRIRLIVTAIVVTGLIVLGSVAFANGWLSVADVQQFVQLLGPWGPVLFVGLIIAGEILQIPTLLWVVVASLVWPFAEAALLSYLGTMIAAVVVLVLARKLLGRGFHQTMPAMLKGWNARITTNGITAVIYLRLLFFMSPLTHWLLAGSTIRMRDYMIGNAIGLVPHILLITGLGTLFIDWWSEYSLWIILGSVLILCGAVYARRRQRRSAQDTEN